MDRLFDANFRQRVITAVIAAPIALVLIILSWQTTALLIGIMVALAAYEYIQLVRTQPSSLTINIMFGILYLGVPLIAAVWLRRYSPDGLLYFLLVLITNWTVDSAALIGGKLYGKRPFAPVISPKKTWEGVFTGIVTGVIGVIVIAVLLGLPVDAVIILFALIIPIATVYGDLLESKLKRRFGVKDSGNLFPGHGGVLDRIDSPIFTLPIAALVVALVG
ncbi:MAG: phosphatidate cytidylyltransferase [Chloroflexi bacterium]|nr:phosphatidate cytidylyltransferase [Chloroflexota bacterium]